MQPPKGPTERPLIFRIASVFDPNHPILWLASFAGVTRSTAKTWAYGNKSWAYGNRRPPIEVLRKMRAALEAALPTHANKALILALTRLLHDYIWKCERDAPVKRLTGFHEVRERDGPGSPPRDGRNRAGRPRSVLTERDRPPQVRIGPIDEGGPTELT